MDLTAIGNISLSAAFDRVAAVASAVAGSPTSSAPVDTIDISEAAVELSQAELQAAISVKILKVAQNIGRQTLDLFA
ncbi:MAG TPA: hypothetical protein VJ302_16975 [Blastocatellia bacterium]|nr:hypothetical protein [Blastocatellia bacterium]